MNEVDGQRRGTASAVLYELWTLDVVTDLGVVCGYVFAANAQQFKNVSAGTADTMALLRYRTGNDQVHLDAGQRSDVCAPLLGASDGTRHADVTSAFHQAAAALRQAAVDFVQRSFDTGERQLRNAFRDAVKTFFAYLSGVEGAVVDSAVRRLETHFDEVVSVLRDAQFSGGVGLPPAPGEPWPRFGVLSGDGAALVADLDRRAVEAELTNRSAIDQAEFMAVQRIADQGAATIDAVIADPTMDTDEAADTVINGAYRWWTAIRDYRGGE
jgi:hypothetical protein